MNPHPLLLDDHASSFPLTQRSRNLVRFARHLSHETLDTSFACDFAFRDAGSRFALLKSPRTAPGPDECFGLWARDARLFFPKLLGMKLEYTGLTPEQQAQVADYNAMNYYRSHVVEYFCHNGFEPMPPTEGDCTMWYPATDVLCVRYRLVNKGCVDVPVRLEWISEGEPGEGFTAVPTATGFRFENTQSVIGQTYRGRAELRCPETDIHFAAEGATLRSDAVSRMIPAYGILEVRFALRFAFNEEPFPEWPDRLWTDESLDCSIAETEAAYALLPQLDSDSRQHLDLTLKAAGTLRTLRYQDYVAKEQRRMTIHVGKTGCAATWFWDTGCSLAGLGILGERVAASGAIRMLVEGIKADGTPPVTYECQRYLHEYQIPLVAQGIGHFLGFCPDVALLADAYDPLGRYVQHWLDRYTRVEGLVVYPPGATSLDDSLRWHTGSPLTPRPGQPWYAQEWGQYRQALYASPDVNAFLYLELLTLAEMSRALGKPAGEVEAWTEKARRLGEAINAWLLEPETQTYQDRHIETGAFTGMIQMGSFIPVYAGIASPEVAQGLCRNYLLSPDHFLTTLPFPTVDRAHPTFRPGGFLHAPPAYPGALVQQSYWRGRTWIHTNQWMLSALWQSGFRQEADEIADRILMAVGRNEGIHECYDSLTGFGNGHPEFLWSSAAVLTMAHRYYRRPSVAKISAQS